MRSISICSSEQRISALLICGKIGPSTESSDAPKAIDGDMAWAKVKNLQKYLDDALEERENLAAEYKKHPNDRSYGKILENNRLIEQLHVSYLR